MEVKIHRGLNQIGGCITEISTDSSRIFIDMGQNLPGYGVKMTEEEDKLMVEGLFAQNKKEHEAVIYTHCHHDHIGLFHHVPSDVPQYLGEGAKAIHMLKHEILLKGEELNNEKQGPAADELKRKIAIIDNMRTWDSAAESFSVGDISITPFFCCHSVYNAYMFLIEADGKRIWHTGDYREHGYLGKGLYPVLEKYATNIDLLITEGTMLSRPDEECIPESEVSRRIFEQMQKYKYIFVLASATDWERIVAIKKASKARGYHMFVSGLFMQKCIKLILNNEKDELRKNFRKEPYICNENIIAKYNDKGFCIVCGSSHLERVRDWRDNLVSEQTLLIYSSWEGYYKDPEQIAINPAYKLFRDSFPNAIDIHTSGHASCATIEKVIKTVNPKVGVLCIHKNEETSLDVLNINPDIIINGEAIEI